MAAVNILGKKDEIYGYQTLYRELGYYISRLEQYERALRFFDEAIKKTPDDRRALMGRARARSKACQYEGALNDIRKALNLDPDDLVMLAHKALNTYLDCEFEDGLVQNTRLVPIRKKPDSFVMGAMHCADAIENCLGERAGRPLRDHYKIIRSLAWKKNAEMQKPYEPKSKYKKKKKKKAEINKLATNEPVAPTLKSSKTGRRGSSGSPASAPDSPGEEQKGEGENQDQALEQGSNSSIRDTIYSMKFEQNVEPPFKPFPFKPLQNYTSNIENYMAEKYLDTLYKDKLFLKNLKFQPGVPCPNKEGTKKILQLAKTGYKTVKYKQELLRARRPFYFIKYQEATSTGALKLRQEMELRRMQEAARKEALTLVAKIREAVSERKLKLLLDLAEKLKGFCDSKSKKILPERDAFLSNIYDSVCQAHFDLKRLNKKQYEWDQEKRVHVMLGLQLSREPSTDSVIGQFKGMFVDWKKQIVVYGERLRKASSPEEMAWLYHELSRFHAELKQFELSRVYARKCINEGRRCNDQRWVINGMTLIMKVNIMQHNKNDAKSDALEAIEVAKMMGDENVREFLEKCLRVIEKVEFDDVHGPKVLQKREQKIVEMMAEEKMKDEAAHLFRMISAMPAARRMSVMPGIRIQDDTDSDMKNRRASIMPSQKPEEMQTSAAPGKQKRGKAAKVVDTKGVGFVELIQYHLD